MTTLRTLECLVALVEHRSVSRAAAALFMSQPALSHQIASLEKELGTPVVERLPRGVRVTAAGRAAAQEAQAALSAAARAIHVGKRVAQAGAGSIRISCAETMTTWLLAPVLRQWRSQRPEVQLDLSEFTSADAMVERLEAGVVDIAIGPAPTSTTAHISVFGKEEIVVVVGPGHRFTGLTDGVAVSELCDEPFIHYGPDNGLAASVDELADRHKVVLNPVLHTRSPRTAAQLAAAGIGATLVPVSALAPGSPGVVRRLRPRVERDVIAVVAAPSDGLVRQFLTDIHHRGLPNWSVQSCAGQLPHNTATASASCDGDHAPGDSSLLPGSPPVCAAGA
ncbi:LysR family transcriptional regulator [Mycobacterium montefiorense]|uniref:LysR family transcriptional regulator n=1 Tax=Mycobacterium montefiorense TaxID=154654 RepID=UPI000D596E3C|nr:LysR family transcriptional regulator [Mycobacterium montefiorense]